MFLFGLEGSGFIISLALTLLISGAIMFYCLRRFNALENSIIEQGRVLQSFIMRTQQGFVGEQQMNTVVSGLASEVALQSAREQSTYHNSEKIEVSDNEEEQGNMDEDSSSYVTSDSENDEIIVDERDTVLSELQTDGIAAIELNTTPTLADTFVADLDSVKIVSIEDMGTGLLNFNLDNASETSDSDNDFTEDLNIESVSVEPIEKIEVNKKPALSKLKVDHLRELVIEGGYIATMEAAKKLKKDDLLKLLQ
jgi:hypothetical protein